MDYWGRCDSRALSDPRLLGSKEIDAIKRGDNFTTHEQFLQVVAVTELFVAKDSEPKIRGDIPVLV
jgi:hypothetical protein